MTLIGSDLLLEKNRDCQLVCLVYICACVRIPVLVGSQRLKSVFLYCAPPSLLRQRFLSDTGTHQLARLARQWAPGIPSPFKELRHHNQLLHGCLGSQLRSSFLYLAGTVSAPWPCLTERQLRLKKENGFEKHYIFICLKEIHTKLLLNET